MVEEESFVELLAFLQESNSSKFPEEAPGKELLQEKSLRKFLR